METLLSSPFLSFLFITLGYACLFLELFIVSFGVLGTIGFTCCAFGVYTLFYQDNNLLACVAIVGTLAAVAFGVRFWLRRIYHRGVLGPETSTGADVTIKSLLGKEGTTLSELRPAGLALLDGDKVDVISPGHFITIGTPIRVVEVAGNRVVVTEKPAEIQKTAEI